MAFFATEAIWFHRDDLRNNFALESYAFESPRVFAGFRIPKYLKERWERMTVVRVGSDIVTHCPPWIFRFCHAGKLLHLKGDASLVKNKLPRCVKYHYPEVVYKALIDYEKSKQ